MCPGAEIEVYGKILKQSLTNTVNGLLNACDFNDNPSLKTRGLAGQNGWPPEETGEPVNAYPAMAVSGGR